MQECRGEQAKAALQSSLIGLRPLSLPDSRGFLASMKPARPGLPDKVAIDSAKQHIWLASQLLKILYRNGVPVSWDLKL